MLGLDVLGAVPPSNSASSAADTVAAKAQQVLSAAPSRAGKIVAHAKKALAASKAAKTKLSKAAKSARVASKKAVVKSVPARAVASQAALQTSAHVPVAKARVSQRVMGDDGSGPSNTMSAQAIDLSVLEQVVHEMAVYGGALDDASMILSLSQKLGQLLPQLQTAGLTDLYASGQSLQNEADNYDPENPTDLAARGAQWIVNAQAALASAPPVTPGSPAAAAAATAQGAMTQTAPVDDGSGGGDSGGGGYGGGGGGFGGGGGGGGADNGGGYDPEADSASEAAAIDNGGGDDGSSDGSTDDGSGDGGSDDFDPNAGIVDAEQHIDDLEAQYSSVVGGYRMRGLDVIGASRGFLVGADAGVDITQVAHAIEQVRPMRAVDGRKLIVSGVAAITAANLAAVSVAATDAEQTKRDHILRALRDIDDTIVAHPTLDPLPEAAAEDLRQEVLRAITAYNEVAEVNSTLAAARSAFYQDVINNTKTMAKNAAGGLGDILTALKWIAIAGSAAAAAVLIAVLGVRAHKALKAA